ncbi:hypothetical protein [Sphingomonas sanxanigenens]|uniref:Uncharacterized protein n=1 Tax=Sphingomonas sanxanigenens DSM 19645 = NX02 TaxID=1123269 RepID=W0A6D4_9SPHN|nr:hypothetical protein [Sphingomonas sanxanigenens]AHE52621.1 hypothetical protein NX02_04365 [Sphingomonas sanxanigenens DSM 19645 = NX02]
MSAATATQPDPDSMTLHFGHNDRPTWAEEAPVYIRYRNGRIVGPLPARTRRWRIWPSGSSDWDIVAWRYADEAARMADDAARQSDEGAR